MDRIELNGDRASDYDDKPGISIIEGKVLKEKGSYFYGLGNYGVGVALLPGFKPAISLTCLMRRIVHPWLNLESEKIEFDEDEEDNDLITRFCGSVTEWRFPGDSGLYVYFALPDASLLSEFHFFFTSLSSVVQ